MKPVYAPNAKAPSEFNGPCGMTRAPDGSPSIPAGNHWIFCQGDENGKSTGGFAVMVLTPVGGGIGLHITLTPDGLRHFADQCTRAAADLDAAAARQAAEAIERAKGAGK